MRQFSNPENVKKHSEITKDMWKNEEYRKKQELARNSPEFKEKMRKIGAEKWERPEYRKRMEKIMKSKDYIEQQRNSQEKRWNVSGAKEEQRKRAQNQWKDSEIKKKHIEARSDPDYKKSQSEAMRGNKNAYKEIKNKEEFLKDAKDGIWLKNMTQKYNMSGETIRKKIREFFGPDGPQNFRELKKYLQDKSLDEVLKDVNENISNRQDEKEQLENKSGNNKQESRAEDGSDRPKERGKENDDQTANEPKKEPKEVKEPEKEEKKEPTDKQPLDGTTEGVSERSGGKLPMSLGKESIEEISKESNEIAQNLSDFTDNPLDAPIEENEDFNDVFDSPTGEKEEFNDVLDGPIEEKKEFDGVLDGSIKETSEFDGISKDIREIGNDSDGANDLPDDESAGGELDLSENPLGPGAPESVGRILAKEKDLFD